jgi:nucleoid DNA-binding protein
MAVENYIRDLLYRYECVIVPGFGAFIARRKPAEIHASTNAFYPPKKSISFNGQLNQSDGLLINYISKTEKISFETAKEKINQFTKQLHKSLSEEKEVGLDMIGVFRKTNDKLEFQPSQHVNYLLDSFGMASFVSSEIKREAYKKEVVALEEKTGLVFTHEKKTAKRHVYLKYAAVGLLALGLSGTFGLNWYSNQVESHNLAVQQKVEAELENKIQQATFSIPQPLPEIVFEVMAQPGNYHIVAGAFREKANAEEKTQQLKQKGFPAREIGANKWGLYQVVYSSYQTRREALKNLYKIRNGDNENAWLLVQEL